MPLGGWKYVQIAQCSPPTSAFILMHMICAVAARKDHQNGRVALLDGWSLLKKRKLASLQPYHCSPSELRLSKLQAIVPLAHLMCIHSSRSLKAMQLLKFDSLFLLGLKEYKRCPREMANCGALPESIL